MQRFTKMLYYNFADKVNNKLWIVAYIARMIGFKLIRVEERIFNDNYRDYRSLREHLAYSQAYVSVLESSKNILLLNYYKVDNYTIKKYKVIKNNDDNKEIVFIITSEDDKNTIYLDKSHYKIYLCCLVSERRFCKDYMLSYILLNRIFKDNLLDEIIKMSRS